MAFVFLLFFSLVNKVVASEIAVQLYIPTSCHPPTMHDHLNSRATKRRIMNATGEESFHCDSALDTQDLQNKVKALSEEKELTILRQGSAGAFPRS